MRYVVVDTKTGEVLNSVNWDGVSTWHPPEGTHVISDPKGRADIKHVLSDPNDLSTAKPVTDKVPVLDPVLDEDPKKPEPDK